MGLSPLSHQVLFAVVRSADATVVRSADGIFVRALLTDAEVSGTSMVVLAATQIDVGETVLYIVAEASCKQVVSLLPLYNLEAATVRSRLNLDAFHVVAKQGHNGELPFGPLRWCCGSGSKSQL